MKTVKLTNSIIFFWCCLLSVVLFMADLKIPADIYIGKFYVIVIILALWLPQRRQTLLFSIGVSVLAISAFILDRPRHDMPEFINRVLTLLLIWGVTVLGFLYKWGQEARLHLASIVDSSDHSIIGATLDGVITSWNSGAEKLYGYLPSEAHGRLINFIFSQDKVDEIPNLLARIQRGETIKSYETVHQIKDKGFVNVSLTVSTVKNMTGSILGISVVAHDITERVRAEKALKEVNVQVEKEKIKLEQVIGIEEGLNTIIDLHELIDFLVKKTAEILEAERCSILLIDEESEELCFRGAFGVSNQETLTNRAKFDNSVVGIVAQKREGILVIDIETDERFGRKNAVQYKSKSFLSAPILLGQTLIGVINVSNKNSMEGDVFSPRDLKILKMICHQAAIAIENARNYRELKYLTITDPITNIYNYRHFVNSLDHELKRLSRYPGSLCLLMIDVDHFKIYNDTFGHLAGDALLRQIGQILKECLRESDIYCRYAGDEFVIILPQAEILQARMVAEKIRDKIKNRFLKKEVTLSIGIAQCAHTGILNRHDLVLKADTALYQAKREGRDRIFAN